MSGVRVKRVYDPQSPMMACVYRWTTMASRVEAERGGPLAQRRAAERWLDAAGFGHGPLGGWTSRTDTARSWRATRNLTRLLAVMQPGDPMTLLLGAKDVRRNNAVPRGEFLLARARQELPAV